MLRIIYVGMDVHTTNYTLCSLDKETGEVFGNQSYRKPIKSTSWR